MSVHYKFKSALEYDTVTFDGLHISVKDLKNAILQQKRIGRSTDFDLQVTNAQTKEVYGDDAALIPENTSLLIARVPLQLSGKNRQWDGYGGDNGHPHNCKGGGDLEPGSLNRAMDLASMDAPEDDKIRAMMSQSTLDYDPSNYLKIRGANQMGAVPSNYRCYKCHQMGHWIKDCPLTKGPGDPIEIKKSTGIPLSFMVPVEGPQVPGAMMTPNGTYAVPALDRQAYLGIKDGFGKEPQGGTSVESQSPEIPDDLLCSICSDLLADAVMIPCCGNSFCDECIRNTLLESEDHECPDCHEKEISPGTLIPNRFLRNSVSNFRNTTGYVKRPQRSREILKSSSTDATLLDSTKQLGTGASATVLPPTTNAPTQDRPVISEADSTENQKSSSQSSESATNKELTTAQQSDLDQSSKWSPISTGKLDEQSLGSDTGSKREDFEVNDREVGKENKLPANENTDGAKEMGGNREGGKSAASSPDNEPGSPDENLIATRTRHRTHRNGSDKLNRGGDDRDRHHHHHAHHRHHHHAHEGSPNNRNHHSHRNRMANPNMRNDGINRSDAPTIDELSNGGNTYGQMPPDMSGLGPHRGHFNPPNPMGLPSLLGDRPPPPIGVGAPGINPSMNFMGVPGAFPPNFGMPPPPMATAALVPPTNATAPDGGSGGPPLQPPFDVVTRPPMPVMHMFGATSGAGPQQPPPNLSRAPPILTQPPHMQVPPPTQPMLMAPNGAGAGGVHHGRIRLSPTRSNMVSGPIVEDPLDAFNRMLREKDARQRRNKRRRSYSKSRSRSRSFSRSPRRVRSRSPMQTAPGSRGAGQSGPGGTRRSKSRSFSFSRSHSRSFSNSPPNREFSPRGHFRRGHSRYRSPPTHTSRHRYKESGSGHHGHGYRGGEREFERHRGDHRSEYPVGGGGSSSSRSERERHIPSYYDDERSNRGGKMWRSGGGNDALNYGYNHGPVANVSTSSSHHHPQQHHHHHHNAYTTNRFNRELTNYQPPPPSFMNAQKPDMIPPQVTASHHLIVPGQPLMATPSMPPMAMPHGMYPTNTSVPPPMITSHMHRHQMHGYGGINDEALAPPGVEEPPVPGLEDEHLARTPIRRDPTPPGPYQMPVFPASESTNDGVTSLSPPPPAHHKTKEKRRKGTPPPVGLSEKKKRRSDSTEHRSSSSRKRSKDRSSKKKKKEKSKKEKKRHKERTSKRSSSAAGAESSADQETEKLPQIVSVSRQIHEHQRSPEPKKIETESIVAAVEPKSDSTPKHSLVALYEEEEHVVDTKVMQDYANATKVSPTAHHHEAKDEEKENSAKGAVAPKQGRDNDDDLEDNHDILELHTTITDLEGESHAQQQQHPFLQAAEPSRWDTDGMVDQQSPQRKRSTSERYDDNDDDDNAKSKVTTEVLKRAENAIFAKAIKAIRPLDAEKLSSKVQTSMVPKRHGDDDDYYTNEDGSVMGTVPHKPSIKDRLGVKVSEEMTAYTSRDHELMRVGSLSPFSRRTAESSSHSRRTGSGHSKHKMVDTAHRRHRSSRSRSLTAEERQAYRSRDYSHSERRHRRHRSRDRHHRHRHGHHHRRHRSRHRHGRHSSMDEPFPDDLPITSSDTSKKSKRRKSLEEQQQHLLKANAKRKEKKTKKDDRKADSGGKQYGHGAELMAGAKQDEREIKTTGHEGDVIATAAVITKDKKRGTAALLDDEVNFEPDYDLDSESDSKEQLPTTASTTHTEKKKRVVAQSSSNTSDSSSSTDSDSSSDSAESVAKRKKRKATAAKKKMQNMKKKKSTKKRVSTSSSSESDSESESSSDVDEDEDNDDEEEKRREKQKKKHKRRQKKHKKSKYK